MTKATIEEIKGMFRFGALGWDAKVSLSIGLEEKAFLYSAEIIFPSRSSSEELQQGLGELVRELVGEDIKPCQITEPTEPSFEVNQTYGFENLEEGSPIIKLELETFKFEHSDEVLRAIGKDPDNMDERDKMCYSIDCAIYVKEKDEKWHEFLFEKVAQFVHKYGNVKAPKPKPKPDPIVPYEGRGIDVEAEVAKIDIDRLREVSVDIEEDLKRTRFARETNVGIGIYLAETGRLRPDNAIMAMTYQGKGLFTIICEWEDVSIDPRTDLIRRNSPKKGFEYFQIDYPESDISETLVDGEKVDDDIVRAAIAFAKVSHYIKQHGKFNPFEIKEDAPPEIKSIFPQKLLDLDQPDDVVREQLVEYLTG